MSYVYEKCPTLTPRHDSLNPEATVYALDEVREKFREVKQLDDSPGHWVAYWWRVELSQ